MSRALLPQFVDVESASLQKKLRCVVVPESDDVRHNAVQIIIGTDANRTMTARVIGVQPGKTMAELLDRPDGHAVVPLLLKDGEAAAMAVVAAFVSGHLRASGQKHSLAHVLASWGLCPVVSDNYSPYIMVFLELLRLGFKTQQCGAHLKELAMQCLATLHTMPLRPCMQFMFEAADDRLELRVIRSATQWVPCATPSYQRLKTVKDLEMALLPYYAARFSSKPPGCVHPYPANANGRKKANAYFRGLWENIPPAPVAGEDESKDATAVTPALRKTGGGLYSGTVEFMGQLVVFPPAKAESPGCFRVCAPVTTEVPAVGANHLLAIVSLEALANMSVSVLGGHLHSTTVSPSVVAHPVLARSDGTHVVATDWHHDGPLTKLGLVAAKLKTARTFTITGIVALRILTPATRVLPAQFRVITPA